MECCKVAKPPIYEVEKGHYAKCWRYHPEFKEEQ
jgi:hypothetical protein